jgi:hypothetical protein
MISRSSAVAIGGLAAAAFSHFCLGLEVVNGLIVTLIMIIILGLVGKE